MGTKRHWKTGVLLTADPPEDLRLVDRSPLALAPDNLQNDILDLCPIDTAMQTISLPEPYPHVPRE